MIKIKQQYRNKNIKNPIWLIPAQPQLNQIFVTKDRLLTTKVDKLLIYVIQIVLKIVVDSDSFIKY